jgi:hypothetical protein
MAATQTHNTWWETCILGQNAARGQEGIATISGTTFAVVFT